MPPGADGQPIRLSSMSGGQGRLQSDYLQFDSFELVRALAVVPLGAIAIVAAHLKASRKPAPLEPRVVGCATLPGRATLARPAAVDMVQHEKVDFGFAAASALQSACMAVVHQGLPLDSHESIPCRLAGACTAS